ncbi:hypothetical protein, partial [Glycomyces salinus]|uniref:hypothetical protein n=1 Tax=Glycomyces salinus TaxID=980294 RepID=UPI001E3E6C74
MDENARANSSSDQIGPSVSLIRIANDRFGNADRATDTVNSGIEPKSLGSNDITKPPTRAAIEPPACHSSQLNRLRQQD